MLNKYNKFLELGELYFKKVINVSTTTPKVTTSPSKSTQSPTDCNNLQYFDSNDNICKNCSLMCSSSNKFIKEPCGINIDILCEECPEDQTSDNNGKTCNCRDTNKYIDKTDNVCKEHKTCRYNEKYTNNYSKYNKGYCKKCEVNHMASLNSEHRNTVCNKIISATEDGKCVNDGADLVSNSGILYDPDIKDKCWKFGP